MSGPTARHGFQFQDRYLLLRLMQEVGRAFDHSPTSPLKAVLFGVEAKTGILDGVTPSGPEWDVVVQDQRNREIIEVKSGAIDKPDRDIFWRRLRRELNGTAADLTVVPVLVVDPTRADGLDRWSGLAGFASKTNEPDRGRKLVRVRSVRDLLAEALWWLCEAGSGDAPGIGEKIGLVDALTVLSRLRIEQQVDADLETTVLRSIELLFADGLSDQVCTAMMGWLGARGASKEARRRLFTVDDLVAEMGLRSTCASLPPGTLTRWRDLWRELPHLFGRRVQMRLGSKGVSIDAALAQPMVVAALGETTVEGYLLTGKAGAGKSTLLAQSVRSASEHGAEVFCTPADAVTGGEELETLIGSLRFRRALLAMRSPGKPFWIVVDGLDEVAPPLRRLWAQHLSRLAQDSQITVVATVRDTVLETDPDLRRHLDSMRRLTVDEWPQELVRRLLDAVRSEIKLSSALLSLLCQPLFLDLYWRTFIEDDAAASHAVPSSSVDTHHGLLAAFWRERIVGSKRQVLPDLNVRLGEVLELAAKHVGAFPMGHESPVLAMLRSESVLLTEGTLVPRLRFRHPLLRDFAFALWCLSAESGEQAAQRWHSIKGGLQRQGALRAIFEGLLDPAATDTFPNVTVTGFIEALLVADPAASSHLARLIGTLTPGSTLDPERWPASIRGKLPEAFGGELLVYARLAGNGEWAQPVLRWSIDATWLNGEFPQELLHYTGDLHGRAKRDGGDSEILLAQARQAARKLRSVSEWPRFAVRFSENNRFLKQMVLGVVIPLLPDEETFSWVERELLDASGRTRGFLLEEVIHLAERNPGRAASLYRQAIGLAANAGRFLLDAKIWKALVLYHQPEERLGGGHGGRSLIVEHPGEFLLLSLDLLDALSTLDQEQPPDEDAPSTLRDDLDDWGNFWDQLHGNNRRDQFLRAVQHACQLALNANPDRFLAEFGPILAQSRSTAVWSIYLDSLLQRTNEPSYAGVIRACLFDPRLYRSYSLLHWMEAALHHFWPGFSAHERSVVRSYVNVAANSFEPDTRVEHYRMQMLGGPSTQRLPPVGESSVGISDPESGSYRPTTHPRRTFDHTEAEWRPYSYDHLDDSRVEGWPVRFDPGVLRTLSQAARTLPHAEPKAATVNEYLPRAIAAAAALLPKLAVERQLLAPDKNYWVWDGLEAGVEKTFSDQSSGHVPPTHLIRGCAELALTILEENEVEVLSELTPEGSYREKGSLWLRALNLADAALVWSQIQIDDPLQQRFVQVLRSAFATGDAHVQVATSKAVRPYHWLRDDGRRALQDELIWNKAAQTEVLIWSWHHLHYISDDRRARILRLLLDRADPGPGAKQLAEQMGKAIGSLAMYVSIDGRRSAMAVLLEALLQEPDHWSFLQVEMVEAELLRHVAFGMKEVAMNNWRHVSLAADFGAWNLVIWRRLRSLQSAGSQHHLIVLFAIHWLVDDPQEASPGVRRQPARDPVVLRQWWIELLPLWRAVAEEGTTADMYHLFSSLRPRCLHQLLHSGEVLDLVELMLDRVALKPGSVQIDLDATSPDEAEHHSWRDVLRIATGALDALREDGLLANEVQRERAHRLLSRLAEFPFRIPDAFPAIDRLYREQT